MMQMEFLNYDKDGIIQAHITVVEDFLKLKAFDMANKYIEKIDKLLNINLLGLLNEKYERTTFLSYGINHVFKLFDKESEYIYENFNIYFCNLVNLKNLTIEKCDYIPYEICNLVNLKNLTIKSTNVEQLVYWLHNFEKLTELNLNFVTLKQEFETYITDGTTIPKFNTIIPFEFSKQKSLKRLTITNSELTDISENITSIKTLNYLDLSNNMITEIPEHILKLENLNTLNLGKNLKINKLPEFVFKLPLETLVLPSGYLVKDVPNEYKNKIKISW